jgi:hypothetical protein
MGRIVGLTPLHGIGIDQQHPKGALMNRQEIFDQIEEAFGFVPDFFVSAPDIVLETWWAEQVWHQSDTVLSARDKALVSFGAASAIHCEY